MTHACLPSLYIPHGGGPCFFMEDPRGIWTGMGDFLRGLPATLSAKPEAILLVSAHWETQGFGFTAKANPHLIYDYYGFPPHTYELQYPAPGAPELAHRAANLLKNAGLNAFEDEDYGFDHAMFIPLKVMYPEADIPVVEMSVERGLDPALHLAAGRALASLRDEGVLIVGSGLSYHNLRGFADPALAAPSHAFDDWLRDAATSDTKTRAEKLLDWAKAPAARTIHPREEHLIPLMVAAGASEAAGEIIFQQDVLGKAVSGFRFN